MVASIFPRHIIEFMSIATLRAVPEHMGRLARTHADVTIMFMDIVGERGRGGLTFMWVVPELMGRLARTHVDVTFTPTLFHPLHTSLQASP